MNQRIKITSKLLRLSALFVVLSLAFISSNTTRVNAQTPTFWVSPVSVTAKPGQTFSIGIYFDNADYCYSWQVLMRFDNTTIKFQSYVIAGFLKSQPEGSTTSVRIEPNWFLISEATSGPYIGKSATRALLLTVKFLVLTATATTLDIQDNTTKMTYYLRCLVPPTLTKIYPTINNGNFIPSWAEDINGDGWVDVFDISSVGISYGRYSGNPPVTKNPTSSSGAWTNPTNAYTSDDVRATAPATASTYGIYGTYGFVTTGWLGLSKIEVGLEMMYSAAANDQMSLTVSGDGGSTWSTAILVTPTTTETMYWTDVTASRSWTLSMLSDANLRVRGTWSAVGGSGSISILVDWIPVRVTPILPQAYDPYADVNLDGVVDVTDLSLVAVKFGEHYAG